MAVRRYRIGYCRSRDLHSSLLHLYPLHDGQALASIRGLWPWLPLLGTIFVAMLLIYLLAGIALAAVSLPGVILVSAQLYSQLGALGGDPLNIPGYFTPLLIVTLTLFYFVVGYISLWAQLASTFLYGSIETQQAEKNKHDREENQTAIY